MKMMKNKLRSRRGASLLIAMVFMMFCAFVGGSVLASATANGYRVAQLAEEQTFLLERSTALLLSDQLQLNDGEFMRLRIVDEDKSTQVVDIKQHGGFEKVGAPIPSRVVTFTLETNRDSITQLQRLMIDSAVQRYLYMNPAKAVTEGGEPVSIQLNLIGFCEDSEKENYKQKFQTSSAITPELGNTEISGQMEIEGTLAGQNLSYIADYVCCTGEDAYSFIIDFGEETQLKLTNSAYCGSNIMLDVVDPPTKKEGKDVQITTDYMNTTVSWSAPYIEKGGAE